MTTNEWRFNFGPIARTDASTRPDGRSNHDTFNLASLPLHVMLDTLMAATNRDEFVAWLWHDLFKPVFYWKIKSGSNDLQWNHIPGQGVFAAAETKFSASAYANVPVGLVSTHHDRKPQFKIRETEVMSDQVEQINLGKASVYIQLSQIVEPALSTTLVSSVIADSFVEVYSNQNENRIL